MAENSAPEGADLEQGVSLTDFRDGKLLGHVGDQPVLLVQAGKEILAINAHCSHYHGPLAEGLVAGRTVHCPWHHACFDLTTGEALHAPAIAPLSTWKVERKGLRIVVRKKLAVKRAPRKLASPPKKIVIVGGGAAGYAAAEMLRRSGYSGTLTMLSDDADPPVDRPNLSKDYLAGSAPEDWMPLQPPSFYKDQRIDLRLQTEVTEIDTKKRTVTSAHGDRFAYDRLLLATGAEPVRLTIPGAQQPNVFVLRSFAQCRAIIAAAKEAKRAVVIGASFIGLEVAAALRTRNIDVHVVAPEERPMERILGAQMGDFVRALHESHGIAFHFGETATTIDGTRVMLKSGAILDADIVVVGIGVRPRLSLAEKAGLALDRGVLVNEFLETSVAGIYAAGDIARWPDPHTNENIRVEHWVVAERQGQVAAVNMLGLKEGFDAVPFFWSQHYDIPINYVGHAERWDSIAVTGDPNAKDCILRYIKDGKALAVASIFRDLESLQAEHEMEATA